MEYPARLFQSMSITTIAELIPDPKNARKRGPRAEGMIVASLHEVGAARSIVIDEQNRILAGNGTVIAAAEAGIERVQVVDADGETIIAVRRTGLTDEQKKRLAILDNRTGELAEWDAGVLAELAQEGIPLDDLWSEDELTALLADVGGPAQLLTDPDAIPENVETRCKPGDLWKLGEHRLLCGDSTKAEDVARLMNGEKAAASITDPPYNVQIDYGTHKDDYSDAEYVEFSRKWSGLAREHADVLLFTPGTGRGPGMPNLQFWFKIEPPFWILAWVKKNTVGHSSIGGFNAWEPLLLYGKPKKKIGQDIYDIPITVQQDVADENGTKLHPTPKQVKLWQAMLEDFTDERDLIYEPFAGSGTTIIAGENCNRRVNAIEMDAHYCDVVIQRFENSTGKLAELIEGGAA